MSLLEKLENLEQIEKAVAKAEPEQKPILQQAVQNLPSSTYKLGKDLLDVIINPITTAKSIFELGKGVVELAIPGEQPSEETAKAVGKFFAERYGSLDDIKNTFANDPAGLLADASFVLTGGASLLRRVPQAAAGAELIGRVGTAIDPITGAVKGGQALTKAGTVFVREILGNTTGVGAEALKQAVQAGRVGGESQARFIENLRGQKDVQDVADRAMDALKKMGSEKAAQYTKGMEGLKLAETPIDFKPIVDKYQKIVDDSFYQPKGSTVKVQKVSDSTMKKVKELGDAINEFTPEFFHTAEGLDILKRKIDDLYPLQAAAKNETRVVMDMRNAVREQILKQVPEYAEVMKPYEEATNLERQIIGELSLGKKVNAGTTLRKLQSVMRNNVNTSYGNRLDLVNKLDPNLLPDLAGQALSEFTPRGLQRLAATGQIGAGALGYIDPLTLPLTLAGQSPRLVGETALKLGQAQRVLDPLATGVAPAAVPTLRTGRFINQVEENDLTDEQIEGLKELEKLLK